jgi:tetratricopeptide (TPR) repeat protein
MRFSSFFIIGFLAGGSACAPSVTPAAFARPPLPARDSAEGLLRQGNDAERHGDSVRAEQYWSLALNAGASHQEVLPALLRVCIAGSRLRAAVNYAEPYLRNHPEAKELRYLVATLHVSLGQERPARLHLEKLLKEDTTFSDAHYLLGILDQASEDPEAALLHYRQYLALARHGEHAPEVRTRIAEIQISDEMRARGSIALTAPVPRGDLPFAEMQPDDSSLFDERGPRMSEPPQGSSTEPRQEEP